MTEFLELKRSRCKDCYKCLRECLVKAISMKGHQARIIPEKCILCGKCALTCPQNAKVVRNDTDRLLELLSQETPVIASIAPAFASSFSIFDFEKMKAALKLLGFADAYETSIGANAVTREYASLMKSNNYNNLITSACPALCKLIQIYYPKALKYLAPVDSPMVAHAKMIKKDIPHSKVVFIGPCIAKKREGEESKHVDLVLTFEDLNELLISKGIDFEEIEVPEKAINHDTKANRAKLYPITRGIVKSFNVPMSGYEHICVDGYERCVNVLDNIESLSNVFLEMNICEYSCVNGPCSLDIEGGSYKANTIIRKYAEKDLCNLPPEEDNNPIEGLDIVNYYPSLEKKVTPPSEEEVNKILSDIGKNSIEDELNCGTCGYDTCREKAEALFYGITEIDVCLPFMRKKAESMSYEIIHNNPSGIVTVDKDLKIIDMNIKAMKLLGLPQQNYKGKYASDIFDASEFMEAIESESTVISDKKYIPKTDSTASITVSLIQNSNVLFGIMKDITKVENTKNQLLAVKLETLATTDEVIKKQMRVAQEIASLLGETTAETKVALLKLKKTLQQE